MSVFDTEVGRAYLRIADLCEATISPRHAVLVAEWAVEQRHPIRSEFQRWAYGLSRARWQALAIEEHLARESAFGDGGEGDA